MIKFLLLLIFLSIPFHTAVAQHEADNWYFGANAGLSFKSGAPTILSDGKLNTQEGSAVMSDKLTGALMFYTDGDTVWNSRHEVMTGGTGLCGGKSSTQSAFIVPNPGNSLEYYIFTTPDLSGVFNPTITGFYYSIVSMDVPLGRVTTKNILLIDSIAEKVTGTLDCTQSGYWVVTHHRNKSEFYSFHITPTGIKTTPVISSYQSDIQDFTIGMMKLSPDGAKIALASIPNGKLSNSQSGLLLYDFDAKTGVVSRAISLHNGATIQNKYYSVCFSPDNTKLYASAGGGQILQFEVNLEDSTAIRTSVYHLISLNVVCEGMQIAPDGKIYLAQVYPSNLNYISIIDKPNEKGASCSFRENALQLSGNCGEGFPNFTDYLFNTTGMPKVCQLPKAIASSDSTCLGNSMQFTDRSIGEPTHREWMFENGTPASSADSIVSVSYTQPGTHRVRLVVGNDNGFDTSFAEAKMFPVPTADAGADTIICIGDTAVLGVRAEPENTYSWQPATGLSNPSLSNPTATPLQTTRYILTVRNKFGCIVYDTVTVRVNTTGDHLFTLSPQEIQIQPGQQCQVILNVPSGVQSWKMLLGYNDRIVHYNSIGQTTNGIIATATERNHQLSVSGIGDSGMVTINFDVFLPYTFDTTYSMTLDNDSSEVQSCGSIAANGTTLTLGMFCARMFRIVSSTGKSYFLRARENTLDFGIGLAGRVRLELYNDIGVLIKVMVDTRVEAGEYTMELDVPTGMYFCRMSAGVMEKVEKVLIVK